MLGALLSCLLLLGPLRSSIESQFGDLATVAAGASKLATAPAHDHQLAKRRTTLLDALPVGLRRSIEDDGTAIHPLLDLDLSVNMRLGGRPIRHIPRMKSGDPPND